MHKRGWKLQVVEIADQVLPRMLDRDAARLVEAWLRRQGVGLQLGTTVKEITAAGDRKRVTLANGTTLDGRPLIQRMRLVDGAQFCLGSTVVKFALIDDTEAAYLEQMSKLVGTDPLTGLHATHRFDHLLAEAVRTAQVTGSSL